MTDGRMSRRTLLYGAPAVAGAAVLLPGQPAMAAPGNGPASPKDHGAAGDGIADDTTAIQACLNANRVIDFGGPENVYLVTGTLLVKQTTPQLLIGWGATIKATTNITIMRLQNSAHTLTGLAFYGADVSGAGLIVEGTAPGCTVDACTFLNIGHQGIEVQAGAHRARIVGCTLRHCGHAPTAAPTLPDDETQPRRVAVRICADSCQVLDNELLECQWGVYFRAEDESGIKLYACRGNTITASGAAEPKSQGISNALGRNGRIEGNTIVGFPDNSIDCFGSTDITISGNVTQGGKDGVFIGDASSSSITITGNTFNGPQRGVRVHGLRKKPTDPASLIAGIVITGNTVSRPTDCGISVYKTGTPQVGGITITDNDVHCLDASTYGIKMVDTETSRISNNRVHRCRQHGIYLERVDIVQVTDNLLQDAGRAAANTYDAIYITGSSRVIVRNNIAYGGARYAVNIDSDGVGMTVTGNRWRSLVTGGVNDLARTTVLSDNQQF